MLRFRDMPSYTTTHMETRVIVLLCAMFFFIGCASVSEKPDGEQVDDIETDEAVFDPDLTRVAYDPTIIMKRAEGFFERKEFKEAVVEYENFLELHRAHRLASYALYKIALCYVNEIQTVDRDPGPLRKARNAIEKLLEEFPSSRYTADVLAMHKVVYELQAEQEVYVGRFYYRTGGYLAALHRLEDVLKTHPNASGVVAKALYYLARTYHKVGDSDRAIEVSQRLLIQYPESEYYEATRVMLAKLWKNEPPPGDGLANQILQASGDWVNTVKQVLPFVSSPQESLDDNQESASLQVAILREENSIEERFNSQAVTPTVLGVEKETYHVFGIEIVSPSTILSESVNQDVPLKAKEGKIDSTAKNLEKDNAFEDRKNVFVEQLESSIRIKKSFIALLPLPDSMANVSSAKAVNTNESVIHGAPGVIPSTLALLPPPAK